MAVPNHKAIVEEVDAQYPHLLQWNTPEACGEFLQRLLLALPAGERWGLLTKNDGEAGYTFPNGIRTSYDYVAVPEGDRVDVINSAAGHDMGIIAGPGWSPAAPEEWRPHNEWIDASGWPLFDSGTPGDAGGAAKSCTIAFGWFCLQTALEQWPDEAKANFDWILGEMAPTVFRVMLAVEGESHGSPDVWRDAGVWINEGWEDRYRRMLDLLGGRGLQAHCTIYGGRNQTPTEDDRRRFHDRIIAASAGRWEAIRSFECMNEFLANHWTPEEVRAAGRDMRAKLPPGFLLSLSSPALAHGSGGTGKSPTNEEMQASFDELYGGDGAGANECTIHTMRDDSKWNDPYSFNAFYPNLPKINNEPPGPGSSAGGEGTDAAKVQRDCEHTIGAGWPMYVAHSEWCVWNGHLPNEYYNGYREVRFVWELPHMPEIATVLRDLGGGAAGPPPPPPDRAALYENDYLEVGEKLVSPSKAYTLEMQGDGNVVLYRAATEEAGAVPIWSTGTVCRYDDAAPGRLNMQVDGNLVLYRVDGSPAWAAGTSAPGAMAQLQDDGLLVIYGDLGVPLWASSAPSAT